MQESTPQRRIGPFTQGVLCSILLHALVLIGLVGHSMRRQEAPVGVSRRSIALQFVSVRSLLAAAPVAHPLPTRPPAVAMHRSVHRSTPRRTELAHLKPPVAAPSPNPIAYSSALHAQPAAASAAAPASSANSPSVAVNGASVGAVLNTHTAASPITATSPAGGGEMADMLPVFYRREVAALIHFKLRPQGAVGTVIVRMHLRRDGTVLDARVMQTSGTLALDQEARDVVLRIHQFDWVPDYAIPGVVACFCAHGIRRVHIR